MEDRNDWQSIENSSPENRELGEILRQLDGGVKEVLVLADNGGAGRLYVEHVRTGLTPMSAGGDGMRRALQIAMTIPGVRDGILLVDERARECSRLARAVG